MMDAVRINKVLAEAGICSRRKADALILAGLVRVNGEIVDTPGLRVRPDADIIEVRGVRLPPPDGKREPCRLLLHKPVAVVSTVSDPGGRPTVLDFVPPQWRQRRLYPAGRLDFFSEGLLLLTDDGDLTHSLIHPDRKAGAHLARVYHVLLRERVTEEALRIMRSGMRLAEGEELAPVKARVLSHSPHLSGHGRHLPRRHGRLPAEGSILELTLQQGLNRQIRRMCRDLGLTILRLIRIAQGPLRLDGLSPGEVRPLTPDETAALFRAVGRQQMK